MLAVLVAVVLLVAAAVYGAGWRWSAHPRTGSTYLVADDAPPPDQGYVTDGWSWGG